MITANRTPAPRTGAEYLRNKARIKRRRKQNADLQRRTREERDRNKQCRTCGQPAARSERTGQLTKQCQRHLDMDVARKEIYILPFGVLVRSHRGPSHVELEYPLSGALP